MHDTLEYLSRDYAYRRWHQNQLSFSMVYTFTERFILPLSHDEVVHGKKSLIGRMPGDAWRQFASLRALYLYQMTHPGSKLLFMGGEFAQYIEWRFNEPLEWFLLQYDSHRQMQDFVRRLNRYYLEQPALWQLDRSWDGFTWVTADDSYRSVYAYIRRAAAGTGSADSPGPVSGDFRLVVLNLIPEPQPGYQLGVPMSGLYRIDLNSDATDFGGSGYPAGPDSGKTLRADPQPWQGQPCRLIVDIPPLCGLILRPADEDAEK